MLNMIILPLVLLLVYGESTNTSNPTIQGTRLIRRLMTSSSWYGGNGGIVYKMESAISSAYITKICVRHDGLIDEIQVWFNNGETVGPYGGQHGEVSCYQVSTGNCILSAKGRESDLINSLQFFGGDGQSSPYWGGSGGVSFTELGTHTSCLESIYVRAGSYLHGIQFNWHAPGVKRAIARLNIPNEDGARGIVTFRDIDESKTSISLDVVGFTPGAHGWHIHEFGDFSNGCSSTGGHYNPMMRNHGGPDDEERHIGDLGNFIYTPPYTNYFRIYENIEFDGVNSIIGRSIVVHSGKDDLGQGGDLASLANGNSGSRVVCGVIERL